MEILHVVLLGFLKYFWRDAVARLSDTQKTLLKTRLSSVDVSGLGFPPLSGETLVTYAGSLTGRDFRAISQVAPFVLYDLVPDRCYDAWVALSSLVPLIWQPEIDDLEAHLVRPVNQLTRLFLRWRSDKLPHRTGYSALLTISLTALHAGRLVGSTSRSFISSGI